LQMSMVLNALCIHIPRSLSAYGGEIIVFCKYTRMKKVPGMDMDTPPLATRTEQSPGS
jgi:hypothetical protein